MNCPHCKAALALPLAATTNVERYGLQSIATTECCGKAMLVKPVRTFTVQVYVGDREKDDWGIPIVR